MAEEYYTAFSASSNAEAPFLTYWAVDEATKELKPSTFTRAQVWALAASAVERLRAVGVQHRDRVAHFMTANRLEDIVFRVAAVVIGCVPVTVNWQADGPDRIGYKIASTGSKAVLIDKGVKEADLEEVLKHAKEEAQKEGNANFNPAVLKGWEVTETDISGDKGKATPGDSPTGTSDERIIIFTSGTTGLPKGVRLLYSNYDVNRKTFEKFLGVKEDAQLHLVLVNPLHHTNSTAVSDWGLRRAGTVIHVIERYTTAYWKVLSDAALAAESSGKAFRLVAPMVSRHIDFLDGLMSGNAGSLPSGLTAAELSKSLSSRDVLFLLGSAPVGPTTVARLQGHFAGKLPTVRFGSTETCLQVMGTPTDLSEEAALKAFQKGWAHTFNGTPQKGYWIGRPHPPFTECLVVRGVDPEKKDTFMLPCGEGEPGQIVTRGGNVMGGYANSDKNPFTSEEQGHWYTNLGDICFWIEGEKCASTEEGPSGSRDFFWLSRDSQMVIKGGANYSCEQIGEELQSIASTALGCQRDDIAVAVLGMKVASEHEDDACVTLELIGEAAKDGAKRLTEGGGGKSTEDILMGIMKKEASKGAKPDRLLLTNVPKNFKGAVSLPDVKKLWKNHLGMN